MNPCEQHYQYSSLLVAFKSMCNRFPKTSVLDMLRYVASQTFRGWWNTIMCAKVSKKNTSLSFGGCVSGLSTPVYGLLYYKSMYFKSTLQMGTCLFGCGTTLLQRTHVSLSCAYQDVIVFKQFWRIVK